MLGGRVDVDHELHSGDVNTSGGDVGGDHDMRLPGGEGAHGAFAGVLAHIALKLDGGDAVPGEPARQAPSQVLGAGEQNPLPRAGGEPAHDVVLGGLVRHHPHAVLHGGHRRGRGIDGVVERVVEELLDEPVDAVVQGGGEQQSLAALRGGAHDSAHSGQEAEIRHVIGLVQDRDGHVVETHDALPHEVEEAPRAGDDDIDASGKRLLLRFLGDTAEDRGRAQLEGVGQGLDGLGDLEGEFAGGRQDQADGMAGAGHVFFSEALDERQGEGEGLTGSGATAPEHIASGEGVGQRGGLNGEWFGEAAGAEVGHEIGVDAEGGEGLGSGSRHSRGGSGGRVGRRVRGGGNFRSGGSAMAGIAVGASAPAGAAIRRASRSRPPVGGGTAATGPTRLGTGGGAGVSRVSRA